MRRAPALVLLCALAAAGETWEDLQREWTDALDAWEQGPHPFEKFQDRFRRFVQDHGNAPEALPAVLVTAGALGGMPHPPRRVLASKTGKMGPER